MFKLTDSYGNDRIVWNQLQKNRSLWKDPNLDLSEKEVADIRAAMEDAYRDNIMKHLKATMWMEVSLASLVGLCLEFKGETLDVRHHDDNTEFALNNFVRSAKWVFFNGPMNIKGSQIDKLKESLDNLEELLGVAGAKEDIRMNVILTADPKLIMEFRKFALKSEDMEMMEISEFMDQQMEILFPVCWKTYNEVNQFIIDLLVE